MLTELRIRNVAVIEAVTLPLAPGFNVLSGETGAGKSLLVGALGLLLGERGSADLVRTGADRATVEGSFDDVSNPELAASLEERGIEPEDGVLVLRRDVASGGKSRAWINDTTVTAAVLAQVGRLLVNLHGQHESQSLLQDDAQRTVLDAFAGAGLACAVRDRHAERRRSGRSPSWLAARRAARRATTCATGADRRATGGREGAAGRRGAAPDARGGRELRRPALEAWRAARWRRRGSWPSLAGRSARRSVVSVDRLTMRSTAIRLLEGPRLVAA